jgi:hypothetical protein
MVNRRQLIEYACPECNAEYGAIPENAGQQHNCGSCHTDFTIPVGLTPRLVSVGPGPGKELTPQEAVAVRKSVADMMLTPRRRQVVVPPVIDDFDGELDVPRRRRAPVDDDKPVKLGFGEYAQMEVDVDRKTRNAMATTFLGGILVALGVFIAAMFGIKKRS